MEDKIIENKNESGEVSLKELTQKISESYRFLLTKWIGITIFIIVGAMLGFTYSKIKKPIYTATTSFVLEEGDKGGGLGQYSGLASMIGVDVGGSSGIFQGDNILELYKSRKMIQKTLLTEAEFDGKKQLLVDRYIAFNNLREIWNKKPELKGIQFNNSDKTSSDSGFNRLQDSILGTIVVDIDKQYLNVGKADKKLSIIQADVKAPDELFAKIFDEQIVKNVNDFYTQTKTKKSLQSVLILQQKTDSVRKAMNGAIYSGAAAADATPNLNITHQSQRVAPVQRSQFSVETNKAMLSELLRNLELSRISLQKDAPLIQVIDEPIMPLHKDKLSKLKGIIVGGFLAGFMAVIFYTLKSIFKNT